MVKIKLDDVYWLTSDTRNYTISKRVESVGKSGRDKGKVKVYYPAEGYLTSLRKALEFYYDIGLKTSEATSWEQLIKDGDKLKKRIEDVLNKFEKLRLEVK